MIGIARNLEKYLSAHTVNILRLARRFHGEARGNSFLGVVCSQADYGSHKKPELQLDLSQIPGERFVKFL